MEPCEVCGASADRGFAVTIDGGSHVFDCFACAIHALAPRCAACGALVIGHGIERSDEMYCCSHCARISTELNEGAP